MNRAVGGDGGGGGDVQWGDWGEGGNYVIGKEKMGKDQVVPRLMRAVRGRSVDKMAIKLILLITRSEQMEQEVEA